jgi:hypothetical protein
MPPINETPINDVWATGSTQDEIETITCPSGQTCRARRPGLEGLMMSGQLLNLDSLTSIVDSKHIRRVKGGKGKADSPEVDALSVMKDPKALRDIIRMADQLLPQIVVEPRVAIHYVIKDDEQVDIKSEDREAGVVYTDQIDFQDKLFIFQYGMAGTRDAERFRRESAGAVAGLAPLEDVQHAAKRTRSGKAAKANQ